MQFSPASVPRSVLFQAPGCPLTAAQQRRVRDRVVAEFAAAAAEHGLAAASEPPGLLLAGAVDNLSRLGDALEAVVKRAAACLDADLIGGANVTRLDRSITLGHARLPYRKALRVANGRGWSLALGQEIPVAAQATLVRFCGLLPVQVLCLPGQPRPASFDAAAPGLQYLLPLAGDAIRAQILDLDDARCRIDLDRVLQFFLGLAEVAPTALPE